MDAIEASTQINSMQVLDVREDFEWDAGHIEGAVHIPLAQLPSRIDELDSGRPVLAVCHVGQRSAMAAAFLRDRGFDVQNLEGGMDAWASRNLPVVQ